MPAITLSTNFLNTTSPSAPASYTTAGRPAASSMPHQIIWVSDANTHQVSDGTAWRSWNVDALKVPRAVDTFTQATRPTAAAAGAGKVVFLSDLSGGTYQISDGTNWATLGVGIIAALLTRIGVRTDKGLPKPAFLARRTVSSTVYINPTLGSDSNSGTVYTLPRQTLPGTLVAGTAYLFINGATAPGFTVSQNGSSGSPIVIGVYDQSNGARMSDRTTGRVTISGQIDIGGRSWISLEHLNPTQGNPRISADNSANCQIICCAALNNSAGAGIKGYWAGGQTGAIEIDGCEASGNFRGIELDAAGGADVTTGSVIQWCLTDNNKGAGIQWGGGRRWENCHIACNSGKNNSTDNREANDDNNGIKVTGIFRNGSSIRWNEYNQSTYSGLWLQPDGGSWHAYDIAGLRIQNNKFSDAQYGIAIFNKANGTYLDPCVVEYNDLFRAGSRDGGITAAVPDELWGRCIEIFAAGGTPEAHMPQHIITRYNWLHDSWLLDEWGTDAQGFGADDSTKWLTAYGNLITGCAGQGIQFYTTISGRAFANLCIGNAINTREGWPPYPRQMGQYRAEIAMGDTTDCLIYGNVTVSARTGITRYGIVGGSGAVSGKKTQVHNNLVCNAPVVGIVVNESWSDVDYNHYRSNAENKRKMNGVNAEQADVPGTPGSIALTANESFSSGPASTDPMVQAAAMSQTLFDTLPSETVTAVAPPATYGETHGGALTDPNTSFIDVPVTLPDSVQVGDSIHVVGLVWSITQAANRVTGVPTMSGETFLLGGKTDPLGEIEAYSWVVPSAAVAGTGKTATVRVTRQDNSFWSFYVWKGPTLAASPVNALAAGSQSGTTFTLAGGAPTTLPSYVAGVVVHNDFSANRAITFTTDTGWTEMVRRIDSNPAPSSLGFRRTLAANQGVQLTTVGSVAPGSWWHGVAVAYALAGSVPPSITTSSSLAASTIGASEAQTFSATGTTPITWALTAGALPPGRALNAATGTVTGARTAGGSYSFTLSATNSVGSASRAFSETITAPALAPSNVVVTPLSASSQRVTWADNSSTETAFEVRRKASPNGTVLEIRTYGANLTTADFTGLVASTSYWYDVRAVAAAGNSAYSPEASGTTQASVTLYAQLLTEPKDRLGADINGSGSWKVAVWTSPGGSDLVGTLVGQYTGQVFEPALVGGEARMRVNLGAASSTVSASQSLVVAISDGTRVTGLFAAVVAV
jgi:hypothetical protein